MSHGTKHVLPAEKEIIEAPHPAQNVFPPLRESPEDTKLFLAKLRVELLQRLDHHQEVLVALLRPERRFGHRDARQSHAEPRRELPKVPMPKAQKKRNSLKPKLFSTFTTDDLAHTDRAAEADAVQCRSKYAIGTTNEEMEDPSCLRRFVKSTAFDLFCALVVVSNSVFLGVEVQLNIDSGGERASSLYVVQYIYTGWFLLELILRVSVDGWQFCCSEDWAWGLLDILVVITSIWEVIVDIIYFAQKDEIGDVAGVSSLKALRIIRITRIMKAVKLMRVFRFVLAFRTLITSIAYTLKSLFWALMLMAVIIYVFAVLFTQAVSDYVLDPAMPEMTEHESQACSEYFGSLDATMLSLFMSIAGGVSWEEVIGPLKEISIVWALCFVFYVAFTYFAVLNVVTGVFCQSAIESAQNDHAMVVQALMDNKAAHIAKLRSLFNHLNGQDNDAGIITLGMFEEKINSPAVREYFEALGLDIWDAWSFFKLLDAAGDGAVDLEDFFDGCLRFRGPARAMDMGRIMQDQRWLIRSQGRFQTFVGRELVSLKSDVTDLLQHLAIKTTANQWAPSQWKAP
mmetsp:Transcript_77722/g.186461  ORF Transcript_77722/g.186461 Transcript_77722/m.186461 type:complete len:570 (+) Transcript_77722:33-1742(+)